MLSFTITGNPYVKKSNQRIQIRGRRPVKVNTKRYNEWREDALRQLEKLGFDPQFKIKKKMGQSVQAQIDYPVNLKIIFYKETRGAVDLSALYEGIQDVLVEVGCLEDDNYNIVAGHDGSRVRVDKQNPRMEIEITKMEES